HPPLTLEGAADHWNHREDTDYFSQPRALFNLLSEEEHQRMFTRIAGELSQVPEAIQRRQIALFTQVDPAYGAGVKKALGLN
ncbi:catalase-related domain-containing protein, partial [Yersinia pestis]|uniref:catalase-related domain-containing protein n=1 Tax=Yersinia pestis TaxID=632 RepID=UPI000578601F